MNLKQAIKAIEGGEYLRRGRSTLRCFAGKEKIREITYYAVKRHFGDRLEQKNAGDPFCNFCGLKS